MILSFYARANLLLFVVFVFDFCSLPFYRVFIFLFPRLCGIIFASSKMLYIILTLHLLLFNGSLVVFFRCVCFFFALARTNVSNINNNNNINFKLIIVNHQRKHQNQQNANQTNKQKNDIPYKSSEEKLYNKFQQHAYKFLYGKGY